MGRLIVIDKTQVVWLVSRFFFYHFDMNVSFFSSFRSLDTGLGHSCDPLFYRFRLFPDWDVLTMYEFAWRSIHAYFTKNDDELTHKCKLVRKTKPSQIFQWNCSLFMNAKFGSSCWEDPEVVLFVQLIIKYRYWTNDSIRGM